jgi:hypothetical protein
MFVLAGLTAAVVLCFTTSAAGGTAIDAVRRAKRQGERKAEIIAIYR